MNPVSVACPRGERLRVIGTSAGFGNPRSASAKLSTPARRRRIDHV
jgi:hypothetical protein